MFAILNLENNQQQQTVPNLLNQFKSEDTNQKNDAHKESEDNPEEADVKSSKNKQ